MLFRKIALVTAAVLAAVITPASAQTINGVYTVDDATNTGAQVFGGFYVGVGAVGTLNVFDGRLVRSTTSSDVGVATTLASATGTVNVTGNHSRVDTEGVLRIGFNNAAPFRNAAGTLNILAGGRVRTELDVLLCSVTHSSQGTVNVSGPGSLLEIGRDLRLFQSSVRTSTVTIGTGGTVSVGTVVNGTGTPSIFLEGGTLSLTGPAALVQQSWVHFNSGAFRFRSSQTLDGAAGFYTNFFGSPPVLAGGRGLVIDGITTLATSVLLDGGSLRTTRISVNPASGSILFKGGTLTLTGDGAVIDDGGDFGPDPLVVGDGTGAAALFELAGAGDVLLGAVTVDFDGALVFGGESLIADSLSNFGSVSIADATLDVRAGLLNSGSLSLADAVVEGDVTNPHGGKIDVAGNVVFNGDVRSSGAFYGSGTVVFNGTLSIGEE